MADAKSAPHVELAQNEMTLALDSGGADALEAARKRLDATGVDGAAVIKAAQKARAAAARSKAAAEEPAAQTAPPVARTASPPARQSTTHEGDGV